GGSAAQARLAGRSGRQGHTTRVVDHLRINVLEAPEYAQAWADHRARDALTNAAMAASACRPTVEYLVHGIPVLPLNTGGRARRAPRTRLPTSQRVALLTLLARRLAGLAPHRLAQVP